MILEAAEIEAGGQGRGGCGESETGKILRGEGGGISGMKMKG